MAKKRTPSSNQFIDRTIYNDLFPDELSKSEARRLSILSGAVKAYASVNFESVSYDEVALPAKTSRKLVQHYFPDKNDLFETTMKLIRAEFQVLAVNALQKAKTPKARFREYLRSTFYWIKDQPQNVQAWLLFYLVCSQNPAMRKTHKELTEMGAARIQGLLEDLGIPSTQASYRLAKAIQKIITGGLVEVCSECEPADIERVQEEVVAACEQLAGLR